MVALMMPEVPQLTPPWVVPSVGPRSHPAFRCLKYGKAGRAWYLFSCAVFHVCIVQLTIQSTLDVYDSPLSLARIYTYGNKVTTFSIYMQADGHVIHVYWSRSQRLMSCTTCVSDIYTYTCNLHRLNMTPGSTNYHALQVQKRQLGHDVS